MPDSPHDRQAALRALPGVDRLLNLPETLSLIGMYGRESVRESVREALESARRAIQAGQPAPDAEALVKAAADALHGQFAPSLRPVINATGVILHTNLGRAPLSEAAQAAMIEAAAGYSTLEYTLASGKRGKRDVHAEALVTAVTGAEAALVVNNNAAATMLMLTALAAGREVIVSRGQLVEIGGGFRMPDVMAQSGARLVEVGTTNRTRLDDFARTIRAETALILRVHASNFKQLGFTAQPELAELAQLAAARGILTADDLGSGALLDTAAYGLEHEPTVGESLRAGFDVVAFSGDKLLGGPQAGIIVGRAELIAKLKAHPLARAFRIDKLCLAALVATLATYRRGERAVIAEIPVWRMIAQPAEAIRARAEAWAAQIQPVVPVEVIRSQSTVGGGSLPGETLPSFALALTPPNADGFAAALRHAPMPVVARIASDRVLCDPRTVLPGQDENLLQSLQFALDQV